MRFLSSVVAGIIALSVQSVALSDGKGNGEADISDRELRQKVEAVLDGNDTYGEAIMKLAQTYGHERVGQLRWELALTREEDVGLRTMMLTHGFRENRFDDLLDSAAQGLDSDSRGYREEAMKWCSRHADRVPQNMRNKALVLARQIFDSTDGNEAFRTLRRLGSKAELSLVRRVASRRFGNIAPDHPARTSLMKINGQKVGYADFVLLRIRFGDVQARREVIEAIEQEDDPQRRIWGIFVAANTDDESFIASIATTLDDKRIGAEQLDEWIDPEAGDRQLFALVHTRVCDVAVFAIHALAQPEDKWPMRMLWRPKLSSWHVAGHGYVFEVFDYRAPVGGTGLNEETLRVNRKWIVGYTDEQLQFVKDFVANKAEVVRNGPNDSRENDSDVSDDPS